ncbi:MAG TPA: cation:proton antiporter, partial [Kofleriaceae bacterium]|nr:cation:proton antiporter [Kofleriaceae bacterium]
MIPLILLLAVGGFMQAARSFSGDTSIAGTELAFGYLLLTAYFAGKIFNRFGLPKLTGYLFSGVISGPFVLGLVTKDMGHSLDVVKDTATAIIALEAGSELHLTQLKPVMKTLRAVTVFAVIGAMFTIAAALFLLRPLLPGIFGNYDLTQSLAICAAIGVALSAQSPAVVMALLAEMRAAGPLSNVVLASVVVADLTVIVCSSIALAVTGAVIGGSIDVIETALHVAWELIGSMVFGLLMGMVLGQYLKTVKRGATLFGLMICVVVAEIGARTGLDPLIVLLTSGIWLRNFSRADANDLFRSFESAQLPVFLVFFGLAGAKIDIYMLWASIIPVVIIAAVRAGSFYMGAKVATKMTGAEDVVKKYAWFGLVPQAGLALALAIVLKTTFQSSFGDAAAVLLFGVVGFNEAIAPPILRRILIKTGEAGKKQGVDFAAGGH